MSVAVAPIPLISFPTLLSGTGLLLVAVLLTTAAWCAVLLVLRRLQREHAEATRLRERCHALEVQQAVAQTQRRVAEASFTNLVNLSEDALIAVDADQRIRLFNAAAERIFGHPGPEALGQPLDILLPERFRAAHRAHVDRFRAGSDTIRPMQERAMLVGLRRDGSEFPLEATISKVAVDGYDVLTARVRDVTAEQRAHAVAEELAAIAASSDDAIIGRGVDGIIRSWNAGAERVYGFPAGEAIGQPITMIVPKEQREELEAMTAAVLRGEPVHHVETVHQRKDGALRHVSVSASPMRNPRGEISGLATIARDITAAKRLEAQQRHAQKLEAVGTLASGIAHDFNNVLAAIVGNAEMAGDSAPSAEIREALREILGASRRGRELIRQIMTFSRPGEQRREGVTLQPVVAEAIRFLRATLPSTIEIREQLEVEEVVVQADPTQLHQVLLNLGTNAGHAMRGRGGLLEIQLRAVEIDREVARKQLAIVPGPYARLTVRDTGHGMPPEVRERIFDPFFTTKPPGEGTGMGLAVVHGIVAGHGGAITVDSAPGRGTRFELYLPRVWSDETPDIPSEPEGIEARGRGEHILLVDDEPALVRVWSALLERSGYRVTATSASLEALERFRDAPETFDLVVTDQTMPGLTGDALAARLHEIRPDLPVVVCTGSIAFPARMVGRPGIRAVLTKPVGRRELSLTVQRLLAEHAHH